nr:immunoglobulin heavy chain junction region [Macaca mulatta]
CARGGLELWYYFDYW